MGVCSKRVVCLSHDAEYEKYGMRKAFVGDIISVFFVRGGGMQCRIEKIGNNYLEVIDTIDRKKFRLSFDQIESFNIDFRGAKSKAEYS